MINLINYVNAANALTDLQLKHRVRAMHERAVADTIALIDPIRVLGRRPPLVDVGEKLLPRLFRTTLAQLRSGFSWPMGDYLFRIGRLPSPLCPSVALPTTRCPTSSTAPPPPTDLCPADLWERPREVARFISYLPSLAHFPALSPPLRSHLSPLWQGPA